MPQVSLYLDDDTHHEIAIRAKMSQSSMSKLITDILRAHFSKEWPAGFEHTFASIQDNSFTRQEASAWQLDTPRESL
ncbi:MAG: hypothetical protein FWF83_03485 [Clostridiales bacterium]|nr:hypothetical protein [Clostridiales bacterium]